MSTKPRATPLTRRDFLKKGAAAALLASVRGGEAVAISSVGKEDEKKDAGHPSQLPKRRLGKTNLNVSVLAYGGAPLYELDPSNPVPEPTVTKMLSRAMERGLNLIDVSHMYGRGYVENVFGKALRGRRDKVVIFSRCTLGRGPSATNAVDESLRRLQTDHIDIYGMHGTWMSEDTADRFIERLLPDLEKAKKAGKIGHIAATCHQAPTAMVKMLQTGRIDVIAIPVNPVWREFLEVVLPVARKLDIGVVTMKALWRGRLLSSAPELNALLGSTRREKLESDLGFALAQDVASVSVGFVFEPEIDEDIDVALQFKGFNKEQNKLLRPKAHESLKDNCRVCGRCLPCPARIDVPRVLRLQLYASHYGLTQWAKVEYRHLATGADQCARCGECTKRCPYSIAAQELVLRAAQELA
jgi:predicted aldo/keto reductase-like oxidoreductase